MQYLHANARRLDESLSYRGTWPERALWVDMGTALILHELTGLALSWSRERLRHMGPTPRITAQTDSKGHLSSVLQLAQVSIRIALITVVSPWGMVDMASAEETEFRLLVDGLALGQFQVAVESPVGDSTITILRADPAKWELVLMSAKQLEMPNGLTARQWSRQFGLTAIINAGMFATDHRTHVGYMACDRDTINSDWNDYCSAAAFAPRDTGLAVFRIFDLDEALHDSIATDYDCIVQNLRLIKRPGENRWSAQDKKWSEAALAEDEDGNILFVFSRSPYSMHDLNEVLIGLPIRLVCAQHLEGGPEAQLYLRLDGEELELFGSYETGFNEDDRNRTAWPIPNALGLRPRAPE